MQVRWQVVGSILVAVLCSVAPAVAQTCAGDCDGNGTVTLDEGLRCLRIALGTAPATDCPACDAQRDGAIRVDEIVQGIVCPPPLVAKGMCLRPGPVGLMPCAPGTSVQVSRCDDRRSCLSDPAAATSLTASLVGSIGEFSTRIDSRAAGNAPLVFAATVDPNAGTTYSVIDFGFIGAAAAGRAGALTNLLIDPSSEAALHLLENNGLQSFSDQGILAVIDAVRMVNPQNTFAGMSAAAASAQAETVAANAPAVQDTIAVTTMAVVDISAEGHVVASSQFSSDFAPELAIDGSRGTSWFSDGDAGGPEETFQWTGSTDDVLVSVAVLSNAQHANPSLRGFGFGSVRVQVLSAAGTVVFDVAKDLPSDPDPDIIVFPEVAGHSVLLTFQGHDDPTCGGFSELQIVARRPAF